VGLGGLKYVVVMFLKKSKITAFHLLSHSYY